MSGTDVAADVPDRYDLVIDGFGYITARAVDPNMPFRVQQQMLSYTPTFLERTNVSGNYGDDSQAFFLTASQNDWRDGEQQRFFRGGDKDSVRRYWRGASIDPRTDGQVAMRNATLKTTQLSTVPAYVSGCVRGFAANSNLCLAKLAAGPTHDFVEMDQSGAIVSSHGGHGLGNDPSVFGMASDSTNTFLSTTAAGTVGVRKWDGASFTTFSATPSDSLAFLNNTLFGLRYDTGVLQSYDTSGTATTVFPWKTASGAAEVFSGGRIAAFGGKLLILLSDGPRGGSLWISDATSTSLLYEFETNFYPYDLTVIEGVIFVGGTLIKADASGTSNNLYRPAVYYLTNGSPGLLWRADSYTASASNSDLTIYASALASFDGGLLFSDPSRPALLFYDLGAGSISTFSDVALGGQSKPFIAAARGFLIHSSRVTSGNAASCFYPNSTPPASSTITSSLIDFDNSLTKIFRGVKVDWSAASDGDGGSVDIAYQLDSLDGSFTTLRTGAVSGTEYAMPANTTGHSISIKITLNKGTSTVGPIVKRHYVRAAPILSSYRINEFILDLGGDTDQQNPVILRDQVSPHPLTGDQQRTNLAATIQATLPITVTDRTGTYTAVLEPANCEFDVTNPGQWYARIRVREV